MIRTSWKAACAEAARIVRSGEVSLLSLDVFDTLLLRSTTPEFVTRATSRKVADLVGTDESSATGARARAWKLVTSRSVMEGRCEDATMREHFHVWIRLLAGDSLNAASVEAAASEAIAFEIENEAATLVPNHHVARLVHEARLAGVETIALSDMYMSAEDVEKLLVRHGMMNGISFVATSGDIGLQKRTGRLFDWLIAARSLDPSRIVHLGDDVLADGQRPAARGIRAIPVRDRNAMTGRFLATASDKTSADPVTAAFAVADAAVRASLRSSDPDHELGRRGFGPVFSAFTHGVLDAAIRDGVSSVWFMAREGALLRSLYDLAARHLHAQAPPSGYLYVSRLASLRTRLAGFGRHEIDSGLANTPTPTYGKLLAPLRLDKNASMSILDACRLDPEGSCSEAGLLALLACEPLNEAARMIGRDERSGFSRYLFRAGFPTQGRVAVVDVGWGCQIQENLEATLKILGIDVEVVGYYLGTNASANRRRLSGTRSISILADTECGDGTGNGAFSFVQPLELACRSPHGTVIGYGPDGTPLLADPEGRGRKAEILDDPVICRIQQGILSFADRYFLLAGMNGTTPAASASMGRFSLDRLSLFPTRKEALSLVGLNNVANLGLEEGLMIGGAASLLQPVRLVQTLRTTLWQEGTCAIAFPVAGPAALLAYKTVRRLPSRPPNASRLGFGSPPTSSNVVAPADVANFDFVADRSSLAGPIPLSTDPDTALFGASHFAAVGTARILLGAPWRSDGSWWASRSRKYIRSAIHGGLYAEYAKIALRRLRRR